MCHSYINAARLFGFHLHIACPPSYAPDDDVLAGAGDCVTVTAKPEEAALDADLVVTDVWSSMGHEVEDKARQKAFKNYQVNAGLMSKAKPSAIFTHCLPAHRGEEVTAEVLEGKQSVAWQGAENRMHAQKALLEMLLS